MIRLPGAGVDRVVPFWRPEPKRYSGCPEDVGKKRKGFGMLLPGAKFRGLCVQLAFVGTAMLSGAPASAADAAASEGAGCPREQATAAAAAVSSVQASRARMADREMARLATRPQENGQARQNARA